MCSDNHTYTVTNSAYEGQQSWLKQIVVLRLMHIGSWKF